MTPKENVFRKPLKTSAKKDSEKVQDGFEVFNQVVDPGSELELMTKTELEDKENSRQKESSIKAFLPVIDKPIKN